MSKTKEKLRRTTWGQEIAAAEVTYKKWSDKYKCQSLEKLYQGEHWEDAGGYEPYVLNLVYATIKIKLSNFILAQPEFLLTPRPSRTDFNPDAALRTAIVKQDALNAVVNRPDAAFVDGTKAAALDSFFRFGMMEVGYAADWRHTESQEPFTTSHENPELEIEKAKKKKDPNIESEIPEDERIYFKHVPAKRFRTSAISSPQLRNCRWVGYYDYTPKLTLLKTPGINFPSDYEDWMYGNAGFQFMDDLSEIESSQFSSLLDQDQICKVWNVWDNIDQKRKLILDGSFHVIWESPFDRINLIDLKWDEDSEIGYYPIPPAFQWRMPQQEINESREQMRAYRRRMIRRFGYQKGTVTPDELAKFTSGGDGEVIEFNSMPNGLPPIQPIPNPEIGPAIEAGLIVGKDDFNLVAANGSQLRGTQDRQTATEAKIKAIDEEIRESVEQLDFSKFLTGLGREALLQMKDNFSVGLWVQFSLDPVLPTFDPENPDPNAAQQQGDTNPELQHNQPVFQFVSSSDLDDGNDFDLQINVVNATPAQTEKELQKLITFLSLVSQFPQVALSPELIREVAFKSGYRNEKIIAEMQKSAILNMMNQISQAQGQAGEAGLDRGNNAAVSQVANAQPNPASQTTEQLAAQVQTN